MNDRDGCFIFAMLALILIGMPALLLAYKLLELWIKTH